MSNKEESLCKYIEYNDIENCRKLLNEGANPTKITSIGRTAIGIACLNKYANILQLLLGACLNQNTSYTTSNDSEYNLDYGESEAKKWKRFEDSSLNASRDDNDTTPEGMENLQWEDEILQQQSQSQKAVEVDDEWSVLYRYYASVIEKTGEMLANTISVREPHCLDAFQQAPIHYAANVGSYECMELLLKHNAPINMSTNTGYTALHLAVEQPNMIELLLRYKANPNKLTFYDQVAPIHMAAKIGGIETIQLLKDAGANINITTLADQTALHLAITFQQYDAALKLIQCEAKINLEDEKGLTPLYTAIVVNDYRMAKMLLTHGARLLPSQYLLNYTIRNRMSAMTRLLIKAGENVNGRDYIGWTPVLLAINQRDIEIIELLLANGAKMNRNDYVLKELHIAVQQSNSTDEFRKIFRILMRHGVNIDNLNKWGETALCLAMLMEKYQIAECLIKEGANVNGGCSIKAKDCMILVRECNSINLIKLFVNAGLKIFWPTLGNEQEILASLANLNRTNKVNNTNNLQTDCCETYLAMVLTNPLSLKQLSRIEIRNRLIEKQKNFNYIKEFILSSKFDVNHSVLSSISIDSSLSSSTSLHVIGSSALKPFTTYPQSILQCLIHQLIDLPKVLHEYLYEFPDVPHVPNDVDIFINY